MAGLLLFRAGLFLFLLSLPLLFVHRRWAKGLFLCTLACSLGAGRVWVEEPELDEKHYLAGGTGSCMVVELCQKPEARARTFRVKGRLVAALDDSVWRERTGFLQVYLPKDSAVGRLQYGDRLVVRAEWQPIEGFVGKDSVFFDYAAFMAKRRVYARIFLQPGDYSVLPETDISWMKRWRKAFWQLRTVLSSFWECSVSSGSELAVIKALVLGERSSDPVESAYRKSGIVHVLAVSGMHLSVFSCMLVAMLGFLGRKPWQRWIRFFLILAAVWGYAVLTGLSPSVSRAACMFSFVSFGKCIGKNVKTIRSLAVSALVLLVWNPDLIHDLGFLLSYLAVIGLTLITPWLAAFWKTKSKILAFFRDMTVSSLSAQLVTMPVIFLVFGEFPTYFLLANWLVTPLVNLALPFGILVSGISLLEESLARILAYGMAFLVRVMNRIVSVIGQWPMSAAAISVSLFSAVLLYLALIKGGHSVGGRSARALRQSLWCLLLVLWIG